MRKKKTIQSEPKPTRGPIKRGKDYFNSEKQQFYTAKAYFATDEDEQKQAQRQQENNDRTESMLRGLVKVGIVAAILVVLYIFLLKP